MSDSNIVTDDALFVEFAKAIFQQNHAFRPAHLYCVVNHRLRFPLANH